MSMWDANRQKQKGEISSVPACSTCGTASVLDPCRSCASTDQLALYPPDPARS